MPNGASPQRELNRVKHAFELAIMTGPFETLDQAIPTLVHIILVFLYLETNLFSL
jgi:hypothetical protein